MSQEAYIYDTDDRIPRDAFALYLDLSPKSSLKAFPRFVAEFSKKQYEFFSQQAEHLGRSLRRPDLMLYSALVQSPAFKPYILVDVDEKNELLLREVLDHLHLNDEVDITNWWVTETHGGYHILVPNAKGSPLMKHINTSADLKVLVKQRRIELKTNQVMTVVPGTLQGGFETRRISTSEL